MRIQSVKKWFFLTAGFIGLAWAGTFIEIYEDVGEHCDFTGSKRSWREYPLGIRSAESYELSPLETFIKKNHPSELEHHWVSYQGTAKVWYGLGTIHSCGNPNALLGKPKQLLTTFVKESPPQEVKAFYDFLRTNQFTESERDEEIERRAFKTLFPDQPPF